LKSARDCPLESRQIFSRAGTMGVMSVPLGWGGGGGRGRGGLSGGGLKFNAFPTAKVNPITESAPPLTWRQEPELDKVPRHVLIVLIDGVDDGVNQDLAVFDV
jgi:hypothetical protein